MSEAVMQEIKTKFAGKWKEFKNQNLEAIFKEMGANFLLRKVATAAHPTVDITVEGTVITFTMKIAVKTQVMKFDMAGETLLDTENGKYKATITYEEERLTSKQVPVEGNDKKELVLIREFDAEGHMVFTFQVNGQEGRRYFSKEK